MTEIEKLKDKVLKMSKRIREKDTSIKRLNQAVKEYQERNVQLSGYVSSISEENLKLKREYGCGNSNNIVISRTEFIRLTYHSKELKRYQKLVDRIK